MNIFPNFRRTLWIGTIKFVNNERFCCPAGFSKEPIPVFKLKCLELTQKKTKNTNFSIFKFAFVKLSTDFVDWNVLKGQQGTNCLSRSLL